MKPKISIITLGVTDLQRATEFYRDGLDLPEHTFDGPVTFFETSGAWLSLFPREKLADDAGVSSKGDGFRGFTLAQNVESREEVDRVLEQAVLAGGKLVKPAEEKEWGGYSGYFADPDGFLWEIAWNPHFDLGQDA